MNRYEKSVSLITDNNTNKRRYETMYYPKFERNTDDFYIVSKRGDRLDLLAYQYYNDESLWWIIAVSNELERGTLMIDPGKRIRIPAPMNILRLVNKMKEIQL